MLDVGGDGSGDERGSDDGLRRRDSVEEGGGKEAGKLVRGGASNMRRDGAWKMMREGAWKMMRDGAWKMMRDGAWRMMRDGAWMMMRDGAWKMMCAGPRKITIHDVLMWCREREWKNMHVGGGRKSRAAA